MILELIYRQKARLRNNKDYLNRYLIKMSTLGKKITLNCFLLSILMVVIFSCQLEEDYPEIIKKSKKHEQYNDAILNMYKLYSCWNCECYGYTYNINHQLVDSINMISCKIILDTLIIQNDTNIYYFKFYDEKHKLNVETKFNYYDKNTCINYYGLAYIGESTKPMMALIPESAVSIYGLDVFLNNLDSCFEICIKKNWNTTNKLAKKLYQKPLK